MRIIIIIFICFNFVFSQNNYPIVLVHGFFGWGNDEMGSYKYWGGKKDIQKMLQDRGYNVINVSVGPISSNWDRAVEIFYQLKGGQIDYGLNHSKEYGLIRKPNDKIYNGLYPDWGSDNPLHFIGHSMGGQTIRMLQYLLETEFYIDSSTKIKEDSELLGQSNKGWISSITSLATPHNGSTLVDIVTKMFPFIQYFIGLAGVVGTDFYDFDLSQWGLNRFEKESWQDYVQRMRGHPAWRTKNISSWDLSLDGASELNDKLITNPNIYYFSYSFSATTKDELSGYHIPRKDVFLLIRSRAKLLGSQIVFQSDGSQTDSTWWENDGIVNYKSMRGPIGKSKKPLIFSYNDSTKIKPGIWNSFKKINLDHYQSVGHMVSKKQRLVVDSLYINHAKILMSLPK